MKNSLAKLYNYSRRVYCCRPKCILPLLGNQRFILDEIACRKDLHNLQFFWKSLQNCIFLSFYTTLLTNTKHKMKKKIHWLSSRINLLFLKSVTIEMVCTILPHYMYNIVYEVYSIKVVSVWIQLGNNGIYLPNLCNLRLLKIHHDTDHMPNIF